MNAEKYSFEVDGDKITIVRRDNIDQIDPNAIQLQILLNPQPHAIKVSQQIKPEHDNEYYFNPDKFAVDIVHDEDYYLNMVQFEADDLLYNVPIGRWPFDLSSEQRGDNEDFNSSGDIISQSIKCDGVSKADIELMYTLIEYLHYTESPERSMSLCTAEWIRVLHCASLWGFDDYRLRAIRILENVAELTPFERLDLARKYGIEDWAISLFEKYANVSQALEEDALAALGPLTGTKIVRLREQKRGKMLKSSSLSADTSKGIWRGLKAKKDPNPDPSTLVAATNQTCNKLKTAKLHGVNTALESILLARELAVMDWLKSSFVQFLRQPNFPSERDIERLCISPKCMISIFQAREKCRGLVSPATCEAAVTPVLKSFISETGITPQTFGLAKRLNYARQNGYVGWLREACSEFISRSAPITFEEASLLSTDEYCAIVIAREGYRSQIYEEPAASELSLSHEESNQVATWAREDVQIHHICRNSDGASRSI